MAKSFDRISSLLVSERSRIKFFNDREIETILTKDLNKFADVSFFEGRVIGLPADAETATFFPNSQQTPSTYQAYVYVRLDEIDDNFLPDPIKSKVTGVDTIKLIMSHPVAILDPNLGVDTVLLGTRVQCSFVEGPANYGKQRNLVINKIYHSPDAQQYKNDLLSKIGIGANGSVSDFFTSVGIEPLGTPSNVDDFAGRSLSEAPAPVQKFLQDLVKIVKANNRRDLLPIIIGSLNRTLATQAQIMWDNVVEGGQAGGINWFNKTYSPKASTSALSKATPGTDYGFTATSENKKLGYVLRKHVQYQVSLILKQGIAKNIDRENGIAAITAQYQVFKDLYQVVPSRHNVGEAVDVRTSDGARKSFNVKVYTTADKKQLESFAKSSQYCKFANLESLNNTGEHLHCSSTPADQGGAE